MLLVELFCSRCGCGHYYSNRVVNNDSHVPKFPRRTPSSSYTFPYVTLNVAKRKRVIIILFSPYRSCLGDWDPMKFLDLNVWLTGLDVVIRSSAVIAGHHSLLTSFTK